MQLCFFCFFFFTFFLVPTTADMLQMQKPLPNVCLRRLKANAFGHLMAWMGPPVRCSWLVLLDTIGLRGPLPGTHLSPPFYTFTPCLHPASSFILQQWLSPTVCDVAIHKPCLFPFQKAQPPTWVIFLGICPVKYLTGAGHQGHLVGFSVDCRIYNPLRSKSSSVMIPILTPNPDPNLCVKEKQ